MNKSSHIWSVLLPAMLIPFFSSLFYFVLFSEHFFAQIIYFATKIFTLVWPILAFKYILQQKIPKFNLKEKKHRLAIPLGLIIGLLLIGLMFGLMQSPLGEIVNASAGSIQTKAKDLGFLNNYWIFAIFLSVIHSLLEEYYWRWFVYGQLKSVVSLNMAHLFAGISFASHHIVVASQFFPLTWAFILGGSVGIGGIIWSKMYENQGTLIGAWVCHILVDLGIMGIGYQLIF